MTSMKFSKLSKVMIVLLLAVATQFAMASFTGSAEKKSRHLYSLKNFNRNFYKNASPFSLRAGFQYKNTRLLSQGTDKMGNTTFTTMMRYEKGNTTYIYPYSTKVILPKFKTPTPPAFH